MNGLTAAGAAATGAGVTGTDFSSTGFEAQAARSASAAIHSSFIGLRTFAGALQARIHGHRCALGRVSGANVAARVPALLASSAHSLDSSSYTFPRPSSAPARAA